MRHSDAVHEVEDNVTAYLEYPNGATGVFISSTGEAPGSNRFEIAGTRGKVILENDQIQFTRNENCMLEHSKQSKIGFSKPEIWNVAIPFGNCERSRRTCPSSATSLLEQPRGRKTHG